MSDKVLMVVNGWTLFTHPLFAQQYQALKDKVEELKVKDPQGYTKKDEDIDFWRLWFVMQFPQSGWFEEGEALLLAHLQTVGLAEIAAKCR